MTDESVIDEAFDAIFGCCQATIQHGGSIDNVKVKREGVLSITVKQIGCIQSATRFSRRVKVGIHAEMEYPTSLLPSTNFD